MALLLFPEKNPFAGSGNDIGLDGGAIVPRMCMALHVAMDDQKCNKYASSVYFTYKYKC